MTIETQTTPEAPAAPAPDTPEYAALMAARGAAGSMNVEVPAPAGETKTEETTEVDPNAPTPKLTDPPAGEKTETATEKEGGETGTYDFAKGFADGTLLTEFNAEKPNEAMMNGLATALGITVEQAQAMQSAYRAGQVALHAQAENALFEAAGGKESFNQMIAWGQANLSQADKTRYEAMLNGPDAATAVEILQARMGKDPSLVNVNARTVSTVVGFRDNSEMVAAMADPRYQVSEAYRAEVAAKVRASRF